MLIHVDPCIENYIDRDIDVYTNCTSTRIYARYSAWNSALSLLEDINPFQLRN